VSRGALAGAAAAGADAALARILASRSARFAVALPDGVRFVSVETAVRDDLARIAHRHGMSVDRLCARIASKAGPDQPLCAAIRAFVAGYRVAGPAAA